MCGAVYVSACDVVYDAFGGRHNYNWIENGWGSEYGRVKFYINISEINNKMNKTSDVAYINMQKIGYTMYL